MRRDGDRKRVVRHQMGNNKKKKWKVRFALKGRIGKEDNHAHQRTNQPTNRYAQKWSRKKR